MVVFIDRWRAFDMIPMEWRDYCHEPEERPLIYGKPRVAQSKAERRNHTWLIWGSVHLQF